MDTEVELAGEFTVHACLGVGRCVVSSDRDDRMQMLNTLAFCSFIAKLLSYMD